jgi:hypothetical protein
MAEGIDLHCCFGPRWKNNLAFTKYANGWLLPQDIAVEQMARLLLVTVVR